MTLKDVDIAVRWQINVLCSFQGIDFNYYVIIIGHNATDPCPIQPYALLGILADRAIAR